MAAWLAQARALLDARAALADVGRGRLMRRILLVLLVAAVVLAGAWALAGLPGRVSAEIGDFSLRGRRRRSPRSACCCCSSLLYAHLPPAWRGAPPAAHACIGGRPRAAAAPATPR